MKRKISLVVASVFLAAQAQAQMFGGGLYGGIQACPYGYGVPSGAISYLDEISDNNKAIRDLEKQKKEAEKTKTEKAKEIRDYERAINKCFEERVSKAMLGHMKTGFRCADYDPTNRINGSLKESTCERIRGTRDQGDQMPSNGGLSVPPPPTASSGRLSPEEIDIIINSKLQVGGRAPQSVETPSLMRRVINKIKHFFSKDKDKDEDEDDLSQNTVANNRMPASESLGDVGGYNGDKVRVICEMEVIPEGLSPDQWFHHACKTSTPGYGQIPSGVCSDKSITKRGDTCDVSDCEDAIKNYNGSYQEKIAAETQYNGLKKQISDLSKANRKLSGKVEKEAQDQMTEAQDCPFCAYYDSQKRYENASTPAKIGSWIQNLMPLMILGGGAYLNYQFGKDYMDNAAKLGYLTGPTPSFLSYGWPMLLAGAYGSVASAASSAFGCNGAGGAWGPFGMGGLYGGGGMYGGMGGAFGMPPWMMGMPMGGGAFMPGMGPWGMASPFGMVNPFMMGGMGLAGMAMMGMGGMAFPGMPMGGFAGVGGLGIAGGGMAMGGFAFPGFPMGGMALGGVGMLGMGGMPMGGMALPGFPMGGMAIGGMGMLAMGGMPMGGFPMGGMAIGGMGDMGVAMQFQMMMQQQQMAQMNSYMQMIQQAQQQQMAKYQIISSLSQEMMALQMQIQQVSMGVGVGAPIGGIGASYPGGFPAPYSGGGIGGPFPPSYQPPYMQPGVQFPGYMNGGALFVPGLGR